jgi:hypothetical protein
MHIANIRKRARDNQQQTHNLVSAPYSAFVCGARCRNFCQSWQFFKCLSILAILQMPVDPDNLSNSLAILTISTNACRSWQSFQFSANPGNLYKCLSSEFRSRSTRRILPRVTSFFPDTSKKNAKEGIFHGKTT